ncbi:N-acetylmuramoyl-L-alanine amidase CwlD [Carboxydothermus pertinax]|uniref:N-acetylmuramoyl-L-alanine amidase CwlD n=1 Tax=Carboxydothermus pertinax TaxID=870242 RepID=A0A1L8CY63_9THEO|nr:N-acetylmuramoyl-L-alanine amidase CwlD [Carboxydothermus pertinax]GAV23858.1 N-acetylmuramoyl-L-alanine amidase CwlD [Carboxydothermus pertinax]
MIIFRVFNLNLRKVLTVLVVMIVLAILGGVVRNILLNREVRVLSVAVAHRIIVLDPGHGGQDPGCKGQQGAVEKKITLDIARRVAAKLEMAGAQVYLTRSGDYDLADPAIKGNSVRKKQDLARRIQIAEDRKAEILISIHANSFPERKYRGAQTFYQKSDVKGKLLAELLQESFKTILANTNRVAQAGDYFINRNSRMASVIAEVGFLSNPEEEKLLLNPEYREKVSLAIYFAVLRYFDQE